MRLILPALVLITSFFAACGSETIEEKLNRKLSEAVSEAAGTEVNAENLKDVMKQASDKMENLDLSAVGHQLSRAQEAYARICSRPCTRQARW